MRFSSALLLVSLLELAAGCHKELGVVVIEGEIAPELDLSGDIYFRTFRGFFFCKGNLLEDPQPSDKRVRASFVRNGNRYTLRYDSTEIPRGGICDWRPDDIVVEVDLRGRDTSDIFVVNLLPVGATSRYTGVRRLSENAMTVRCDIDYSSHPAYPDCDRLERVLEDTSDEVHLRLNVKYEKGHEPVRD